MRILRHILLCMLLLAGTARAGDEERKLVSRTEPEYPDLAVKMNLHGAVKLKIWINPDGTVRRLEYIGGHPVLAASALKAVKDWKYEPAAKESTETVEVKF
ncbi:MAG: energy transducer TonB [Acidobacteriia bacterium]|nr:energy transducer TonB [Terriglobia bacterium]